jgi:hypothetical protein
VVHIVCWRVSTTVFFHRIVAFVAPPEFQLPPDDEKPWCLSSKVAEFGECHSCYFQVARW